VDNVMGWLEKAQTLLQSRRFWLYVARAAVSLLVLVGMVMPLLGKEAPDVPDEEALAERLMARVERVAAIIGAVIVLWQLIADGRQVNADFTVRPPGARDRHGVDHPPS
jgi:hypothetical protein